MASPLLDAIDALPLPGLPTPEQALQRARLRTLAMRALESQAAAQAAVARYQAVLARALEVASSRGLGPVAEKVIDGMLEVAEARRGFVGLADGAGGWSVLAARNMGRDDIPDPKSQLSTSIIDEVLRLGQPVVTEDARQEERLEGARSVFALRLRSVACLPLVWEGSTIGFVYLDDSRTRGVFDEAALTAVRAWLPLAAESVHRARETEADSAGPMGFPTRSRALLADLERLARAARYDASVLLTGETGTGKSLLARKIHEASARASRPFVHVNCGGLPEALLEAELFGAEAGAYTGSKGARAGRFEAAEGGTLFLDELDTMPIASQVKLLVALQERMVVRLGSNQERPVDVRIIAAMSSDPARAIAEGRLREDLYYRLAVLELRLPALRDRTEDLPLIVRSLLESTRRRYGLPPLRLSPAAMAALAAQRWPGNVRELQNAIDRAALYSVDGEISEIPALPMVSPTPTPTPPREDGLLGALRAAARRYVDELQVNPRLRSLDLLDGLRGLVVREAIARFGGRDEAFRAFGEEDQVVNRNHHRSIRRDLDRLASLEAVLDR